MLEAKNISVWFGNRSVIDNVSLELEPGQIMVLLGPNGAGKTTLLRALNGTVGIKGGTIELDGKPLSKLSRREIARQIAVVAQENETKFPITVIEFVLAGRFTHGAAFGWESADDIRAAENALKLCDLDEYGGRVMNELSGGERQRVVLARALAAEAKVLLLDEPTANLDLAHQALMFRLVRDRSRNAGASAIVITHDLNLASEFADHVVLLKDGKVYASGPTNGVLTKENIAEVYGVQVLLDSNPASGKVRVTTVY
ncbi:MAG: heme ABC transporter ATP-binding protein [Acidobacteria bacterium]|nr:MAG: heme ABC transporter ATP-binding protein [Acidobacteriota bacterium]